MVYKSMNQVQDRKECVNYLDQPKRGGAAQAIAMIQVKMTPAAA